MVVMLSPWLTKPTAAPDQNPPTSGRVDFDGLTPGQAYLVTANAVGTAGPSDWSDDDELMVV